MKWLTRLVGGTPSAPAPNPPPAPPPGATPWTPLHVSLEMTEEDRQHEMEQERKLAETKMRLDILEAQLKNITRQGA